MNYKQLFAIKKANRDKILKHCPNATDESGIYFLLREENGFKWAYVGQAKHILSRLADHLQGYQHIDLSLKKHGLWSEENPTGYKIHFLKYPETMLDEMEQKYIKQYANAGYQMKNATSGSQGVGKKSLDNSRPSRGYFDGIEQGKKNVLREISHLFEKYLDYVPKKNPPTKLQEKAMQKFKDFLDMYNERG